MDNFFDFSTYFGIFLRNTFSNLCMLHRIHFLAASFIFYGIFHLSAASCILKNRPPTPLCPQGFCAMGHNFPFHQKGSTVSCSAPSVYFLFNLENSSYADWTSVINTGIGNSTGWSTCMHNSAISYINTNMSTITYYIARLCL